MNHRQDLRHRRNWTVAIVAVSLYGAYALLDLVVFHYAFTILLLFKWTAIAAGVTFLGLATARVTQNWAIGNIAPNGKNPDRTFARQARTFLVPGENLRALIPVIADAPSFALMPGLERAALAMTDSRLLILKLSQQGPIEVLGVTSSTDPREVAYVPRPASTRLMSFDLVIDNETRNYQLPAVWRDQAEVFIRLLTSLAH